jgi:transposase
MSKTKNSALRGRVAQLVRLGYSAWRIAKECEMKVSTVKDWKRQCLENEELFLQGPHYSHAGNPKFSDREKEHMAGYLEEHEVSARDAAPELSESVRSSSLVCIILSLRFPSASSAKRPFHTLR